MIWTVPEIWEDEEVWILGGGSSIVREFNIPTNIVNDVLNRKITPSAYSPYLSQIHNKHVIGVNAAYKIGNWMDFIFFGDKGFFLENMIGLSQYPGLKISCHPYVERFTWVKYLQRDVSKTKGLTNNIKKVSWNGNSGSAAINLAVHTKAKRIILLGFDMNLSVDSKQHWHNEYNNQNKKRFAYPFDGHLKGFPFIFNDVKKLGVEIINASPTSNIKEFPKCSVKELL
jgi:hypothetical protein